MVPYVHCLLLFNQLREKRKLMLGIFYKVGKIRANLQGVSHK